MTGLTPDSPTPDPFSNIPPLPASESSEVGSTQSQHASQGSNALLDGATTPRTPEEQALAMKEVVKSIPPPPLINPKIPQPLDQSFSTVPPKDAPVLPPFPSPSPVPSPRPESLPGPPKYTVTILKTSNTPPPTPTSLPTPEPNVVAKPDESYPTDIKELKSLAETTCKEARKAVRHTSGPENKTGLEVHEAKVDKLIKHSKKLQTKDPKAVGNLLKDLERVEANLIKAIHDCEILETLDSINSSLTDIERRATRATSSTKLAELKGEVSDQLTIFNEKCEKTVVLTQEVRFEGTSRVHDKSAKTLRRLESTGAAISRQEKALAKHEKKITKTTTTSKQPVKTVTQDNPGSVKKSTQASKKPTSDSHTAPQAPRKKSIISSLTRGSRSSSPKTDGSSRLKSFEGEISRIRTARENIPQGDENKLVQSLMGDDLKRLCESLKTKVEEAYKDDQTVQGQREKATLLEDINQEKENLPQAPQSPVEKDSIAPPPSKTPEASKTSPPEKAQPTSSSPEQQAKFRSFQRKIASIKQAREEHQQSPKGIKEQLGSDLIKAGSSILVDINEAYQSDTSAEGKADRKALEKQLLGELGEIETELVERRIPDQPQTPQPAVPPVPKEKNLTPSSPSKPSVVAEKGSSPAHTSKGKVESKKRGKPKNDKSPKQKKRSRPEKTSSSNQSTSSTKSSKRTAATPQQPPKSPSTKSNEENKSENQAPPQPPSQQKSASPVSPRSKQAQNLFAKEQPTVDQPPSRPPLPSLPPAPPQSPSDPAPNPQADTPAPLPSEQSPKDSIQQRAVKQSDTSPAPSNKPENATSKPPSIHVQRHPRSLEDQKKESDNQKANELFNSFIGTVGEAFGVNTEKELLKAVHDHKSPDLVAIMTDTALDDIEKAEEKLKLGEENKEVQKLVKDKIRTLKRNIKNPTSPEKLTRLTQSAPASTRPTEPSQSNKTDSPRSRLFRRRSRNSRRSGTGMEESQSASDVGPASRPTVAPRPDKSLKKFKSDPSMDKLLTVLDQLSELESLDTSGKQLDKTQKLRTQVAEAAYKLDVIKPDELTGDTLEGKKEQIAKLREFANQIPTENQSEIVKSFRQEVQSLNKHLVNLESAKEAIDGLDLSFISKKVVDAKAELRKGNTGQAFKILDEISLGKLTPDELASKTELASHPDAEALADSTVRTYINWAKETAHDLQDLNSIRAVLTAADAIEDQTSLDDIEAGMGQVQTYLEQGSYDEAAARLNEINKKLPAGGLSVSRNEVKKAKSPTSPVTLHANTQAKLDKTCRVLAEVSKTIQSTTSQVDRYTERALSSMEKDYEKTYEGQVYRPTEQLEYQNSSIVTQLNTVERLLEATELMLPLTTSESSKDQEANLTLIKFKRGAATENAKKLEAHREFETNHTSIIGRVQSLEGQLSKIEGNSSAAREDRISQANSLKKGIEKLKEEIEKLEPKAPQYYQDVVDNLFKRAEGISQIIDLQASAKELKTHLDELAKVPDHELASKMKEFDGTHGSELKKVEESISDLGKLEQAFHKSDTINESIKSMRARPGKVQKLQRVLGEFGDTEASMRGPLKRSFDLVFNDSNFRKIFTKDELKEVTEMQQALESFVEKTKGLEEGLMAFTSRQAGMADLKEDSISNLVQLIEDNMNAFLEAYAPCVEVYEASIAPDSPLQKNEDAIKVFLSREKEVNQKKDTLAHHTSWPPAILPVQRGMRYPMLLEEAANSLDKLGHSDQASQVRDVKSKFEEQLKALKKKPN